MSSNVAPVAPARLRLSQQWQLNGVACLMSDDYVYEVRALSIAVFHPQWRKGCESDKTLLFDRYLQVEAACENSCFLVCLTPWLSNHPTWLGLCSLCPRPPLSAKEREI